MGRGNARKLYHQEKEGEGDMSVSPKTEIEGEHDIYNYTSKLVQEVPKNKFISEIIGLWFKFSLVSPPRMCKKMLLATRAVSLHTPVCALAKDK